MTIHSIHSMGRDSMSLSEQISTFWTAVLLPLHVNAVQEEWPRGKLGFLTWGVVTSPSCGHTEWRTDDGGSGRCLVVLAGG